MCTSKLWTLIQLTSTARDLGQLKDIWNKGRRKSTQNVGLLLNGAGNLVTTDKEEAESLLLHLDLYW